VRYGVRVSSARLRARPAAKRYDRESFDRWYRDPRKAVVHRDVLARRVQLAVAAAEYLLERPIRSVLDVGCGEAPWRALLLHARPGVRYVGVDSSAYAVRRFGRTRGIRLGTLGGLGPMKLGGPFDLVVCSDVLHYVETAELARGLRSIQRLVRGVAFLELFTKEDATIGDDVDFQPRSAATYRRMLRAAGFVPLGLHCYAGRALEPDLIAFERGAPEFRWRRRR
jgi:SAM-dependent methyltransferase